MHGAPAATIAVLVLAASLFAAVVRPRGVSEALVAVPGAVVVTATGILPLDAATDRLREIGPTVAFLAGILVFGHLCAEAGVFDHLGSLAARAGAGRPRRLLVLVVALAALVTSVLTLDATVVLLTPVVLRTTARMRVPARPYAYACTRLANSGSLLLPVSNLTNLLGFTASRLSFGRFAALMVLPWVLVCFAEWLGLRLFFRRDLPAGTVPDGTAPVRAPRYAIAVLGVTVTGLVITTSVHVAPAWAALGGCVLLIGARLRRRDIRVGRLVAEASPGFCLFVLALAVTVAAVTRHGLGDALARLLPSSTAFGALLLVTVVAAALANLVNNLPATLALVPLVAGSPMLVLAVLLGVNVGPNLSYGGSLATLLWRRLLPDPDKPRAGEFHLLGVLSVPVLLVLATSGLWAAGRVVG